MQRGRRRRQGREKLPLGPLPLSDDTAPAKAARANWARFIKKVFTADPLVCPDCGGAMRVIAFIEDQRIVRAILVHLSLWDPPRPRPPPLPAGEPTEFMCVLREDRAPLAARVKVVVSLLAARRLLRGACLRPAGLFSRTLSRGELEKQGSSPDTRDILRAANVTRWGMA